MKETDLSEPIKEYLRDCGYKVQAEVKNCDIAAIKQDELVIVELKTSANMTLLIQATARQNISPLVYVAIPEPSNKKKSNWKGIKRVVAGLGLGLFVVNNGPLGFTVKLVFEPGETVGRRISKKRKAVIDELSNRSLDLNTGGSNKQQLITAYRENAIFIACCLRHYCQLSTRQLRKLGTGEKTTAILWKNYYGWFERVKRGTYTLTKEGRLALDCHPQLCALSESRIREYETNKDR